MADTGLKGTLMDAILYAEIYAICLVVVAVLLFWTARNGIYATNERWMFRVLLVFAVNFISNFLFTLFHSILAVGDEFLLDYIFKSLYHLSLAVGVIFWCVYAEVDMAGSGGENRGRNNVFLLALILPVTLLIVNIFTRKMFCFSDSGAYVRGILYHVEMIYLTLYAGTFSVRVLKRSAHEIDPARKSHLWLVSSFSLCVLVAWLLSFVGEAFPVICVVVMVELLFLFMGTTMRQISMDKLTQTNNRQNLMGFLNYKIKNNGGDLHLLLLDLDYFKVINDRFGHLEGDRALVCFSSALKTACGPYLPRPYVARYGGDEFIVVIEADKDAVERLCADIRANAARFGEELPYDLRVSIGVAKWDPAAMTTVKNLIDAADKDLYRVKAERKP